jgi:hypothetical protein
MQIPAGRWLSQKRVSCRLVPDGRDEARNFRQAGTIKFSNRPTGM